MLPLEKIAENPKAATISENLVLVADPYGDFRRQHGNLRPERMDEIIAALKDHFAYGEGLISRFRHDLGSLESRGTVFNEISAGNAYDMLKILLDTKPQHFDDQLATIWRRHYRVIESGGVPDGIDPDMARLVGYTHKWHHYVQKKPKTMKDETDANNPFLNLKKIAEDGVTMHLRSNPNQGYPNYTVYGWLERIKTRNRIVSKLLYKIFKAMEEAEGNRNFFYRQSFVKDEFGVKVIGARPNIRDRIEKGVIYRENSPWVLDEFEDYNITRSLNAIAYLFRYSSSEIEIPEKLQVQVVTFVHFLLNDFFERKGHQLYRARRESDLRDYERQNRKLYDRMERAMTQALSFLSK